MSVILDKNGQPISQFAYKAIQNSGNRAMAPAKTTHADTMLNPRNRAKLISTVRESMTDHALLGWALRKHLSHVADFALNFQTDDMALNNSLEKAFARAMRPENSDVSGRHSFQELVRLFEAGRLLDGDAAMLRISKGAHAGKVQLLEGDLISKPSDKHDDRVNNHGLILDQYGAATHYQLCRWDENGKNKLNNGLIKADDLWFNGYFERSSQTRGVSPLAPALHLLIDLHESLESSLLKHKVQALIGFIFHRDSELSEWAGMGTSGTGIINQDHDGAQFNTGEYDIDLSSGNILNLSLDAGDKVQTLKSDNPSEAEVFWTQIERLVLGALDIPLSFWKGEMSSYSHTRSDREQYEKVCGHKRKPVVNLVRSWVEWRIADVVRNADLESDVRAVFGDISQQSNFFDLCDSVIITPATAPWSTDASDRANAASMELANGLNSRSAILAEQGRSFLDVVDQLAKEQQILRDSGITTTVGVPGASVATGDKAEADIEKAEAEAKKESQDVEQAPDGVEDQP
jgi:capsid protein